MEWKTPKGDLPRDLGIRLTIAGTCLAIEVVALFSLVGIGQIHGVVAWSLVFAAPFALYVWFVRSAQGTRLFGWMMALVLLLAFLVVATGTGGSYRALVFVFFAQPFLYIAAVVGVISDLAIRGAQRAQSPPSR